MPYFPPAGTGAGDGYNILSAGTQVANTTGTVLFSNANNISFGMNNNSVITASASLPGGAGDGYNIIGVNGAGTSASTTLQLSNSNNVTFGLNAGTITASASFPAQTQYVFSNSNGVSFGTNGSTVTATVRTDYQSAGAYLTTARASNDGIGLNTAFTNVTATVNSSGLSINASGYAGTNSTFNGTNISGSITQNSNGIQLNLSVNPSGGAGDGYNIIGVNGAGTSASTTIQFSNANNVSFGLNAGTITASASYSQSTQPVAVSASNGSFNFSTLKFVETNGVTWATSTDGIRASIKTDYQSSNPNYLTSQSNQAFSASGGSSAFQTLNFANSNGITFSNSNGSVIASHNGLTTARASNDAVGLNTAQSNVTWTVNSSGISLDARNYAGTATGATNASITANSNGISISVGAGGGAADGYNSAQFTNSTANSTMPILWAGNSNGSGNITMGLTGSTVTASAPSGGGAAATLSNWEVFPADNNTTFSSMGQNSLYLQKLRPGSNYAFSNFELRASGSFVSSSNSQRIHHTINYGLYSLNGATYSSIATSAINIQVSYNSTSAYGITVSQGAASYTVSSNNTALASFLSGFKHLYLPFTSTLTAGGEYAFGLHISSATTVNTGPYRLALLNHTIINNLTIGKIYASTISASNASFVGDFAMGVGSVTTGAFPSSVAQSALTNAISQQRLYIQLD